MRRATRLFRIRATWGEYVVASTATSLLEERLRQDPSFGSGVGYGHRDVRGWRAHLEGTFLIRMFAEIEAGLRDAWAGYFRQTTQPRMMDLIESIAARRSAGEILTGRVHAVRDYRNSLIHEGRDETEAVSLGEALPSLEQFLARLPYDW